MDAAYISEPNYQGYVVIGAGLPRTGTASLRLALSQLLGGPIYHMIQVLTDGNKAAAIEFWTEACQRKKSAEEWKDFLKGFRGGVDFPPSLFYRLELHISS